MYLDQNRENQMKEILFLLMRDAYSDYFRHGRTIDKGLSFYTKISSNPKFLKGYITKQNTPEEFKKDIKSIIEDKDNWPWINQCFQDWHFNYLFQPKFNNFIDGLYEYYRVDNFLQPMIGKLQEFRDYDWELSEENISGYKAQDRKNAILRTEQRLKNLLNDGCIKRNQLINKSDWLNLTLNSMFYGHNGYYDDNSRFPAGVVFGIKNVGTFKILFQNYLNLQLQTNLVDARKISFMDKINYEIFGVSPPQDRLEQYHRQDALEPKQKIMLEEARPPVKKSTFCTII